MARRTRRPAEPSPRRGGGRAPLWKTRRFWVVCGLVVLAGAGAWDVLRHHGRHGRTPVETRVRPAAARVAPRPDYSRAPVTPIETVPSRAPAPGQPPRMAIILDDWGTNYQLLREAVRIGRPLTLAVIPHLPHSRRISSEAAAAGLGVMLHMPMEPFSKTQPLEPRTIRTTTSDAEIRRYLDEALRAVPEADGVNNHMGSAATSDERVMRAVLSHLRKGHYFFIDSHTVNTSVAPRLARELDVTFGRRDVFIDNEMDPDKIKVQLRRAVETALRKGESLVIGHDKAMTLRAVREMVPEIERAGVRLVLARELVRPAGDDRS